MSMAQIQLDEDDIDSLIWKLSSDTFPGKDNVKFMEGMGELSDVVTRFVLDTNNWFEIIDVRLYRDNYIGIPCRFRWTIKRWANNDIDSWLKRNGWILDPHLRADSREHEDHEMEARYIKEYGDYTVAANMYVEFTEDVIRKMQNKGYYNKVEEKKREKATLEEIRDHLRS